MTLNKDFVLKAWVPALRSGEYAQTTGRLHDDNGYCCLGVACDLLMKQGVLPGWESRVDGDFTTFFITDPSRGLIDTYVLPEAAVQYIGTDGPTAYFSEIRDLETGAPLPDNCLTNLNDDAAFSFEEIADFLEDVATKEAA